MSSSHGTRPAIAAGTADGSPLVPIEDPVRKACTAEEQCVCIWFEQERALYNTDAEMKEVERSDTPFVLAGLAWCPR